MPLLTCLMRTLPSVMVSFGVVFGPLVFHHTCVLGMCYHLLRPGARTVANARDFDSALAGDLLYRCQLLQTVQRRQYHVVRVGRPEALGEDVGDARALHDRAHRSAGNYTSSRCSRLHENSAGAMAADNLVRNRAAGHRYADHVAACTIDSFAHRFRHFVSLAGRKTDAALTISHRN